MIMYSIVNVLFMFLILWNSILCVKEELFIEEETEKTEKTHAPKAKPPPSPASSSRSKRSRSSSSSKRVKKVQKKVQERKAMIRARLSAQPTQPTHPIGATPKKKLDLIKRGMKKSSTAYPTFDDVVSDWGDEQKKSVLKPKETQLNRKEKMIAMGAKRQETAYPTMDDVVSDWGTNESVGKITIGPGQQGKGATADDVDFELHLLEPQGGKKTKTRQR